MTTSAGIPAPRPMRLRHETSSARCDRPLTQSGTNTSALVPHRTSDMSPVRGNSPRGASSITNARQ
jgi:hypothetical protein